ncbi:MAG: hypothetical protein B7Z12_12335, partial [Caulobacter vibrioides]
MGIDPHHAHEPLHAFAVDAAIFLVEFERHPARFPSDLPAFFIKMLTDEEDVVLDIFGGSNTTG